MRIYSITLRNYRLHRECSVQFDPQRTLIGGPNESGKSTLIEAMHRALFLNAKGNTAHHRAMVSTLHPGNPEVELCFEAGGTLYTLKKRFGSNGTVSLAPANAEVLIGPTAEAELARVIGANQDFNAANQWGHLWVWQGKACEDPSGHATDRQGEIIDRLQQIGGGTPLQSGLDTSLAEYFKTLVGELFTLSGHPKANSALGQAEAALAVANEELARARAQVEKLESWAEEFESTRRATLESEKAMEALSGQWKEVESKGTQLAGLRQQETGQAHEARETAARHAGLENANKQILLLRRQIELLQEELLPKEKEIARLESAWFQARQDASLAEQLHNQAGLLVSDAKLRLELSSAHVALFTFTDQHAKLARKGEKIAALRAEIAALEEQLARLPRVDAETLRKVQELEGKYLKASTALTAMATGLEVLACDQIVTAGEREIASGTKQVLTEDTVISIGANIRIRIQPGGGTSLADARMAETEAQAKLKNFLVSLGINSVEAGVEVCAARVELSARIKAGAAELKGMGEQGYAAEYQNAANDLAAAKANVERLALQAPEVIAPSEPATAGALLLEAKRKLSELESQEAEAKARRTVALKRVQSAEELLQEKRAETTAQAAQLTGLKANHELLSRTHGEEEVRTRVLIEAQTATEAAAARLQRTVSAIAAMQPELLEGDRERIKRALQQKTEELNQARTRNAVARAALRSDGAQDPRAVLASAQAKARSAAERHAVENRRAGALRLLDRLFQEEQRTLSDQFAKPLAEKVSGYLQCIFGPGARAQVNLVDNAFSGLQISQANGGSFFGFEKLSGGAKEQVAAAFRLAMAELLADNFHGCLPLVFDDAFVYSDPDRVIKLQRMLDLAASRGLQILVLTCTPFDYAGLGARQTILDRSRSPSSVEFATGSNGDPGLVEDDCSRDKGGSSEPVVAVLMDLESRTQQFLIRLRELGGKAGNRALREALGWDEPTYSATKHSLITTAVLVPGKGKGGSVSLASLTGI